MHPNAHDHALSGKAKIMLATNTYPKEYVAECRLSMEAQLRTHRALAARVTSEAALETFDIPFYNNLLMVMDCYFVHRNRAREGEGNALTEVRTLCTSLLHNEGVLAADESYDPARTLLKLRAGDRIRIGDAGFTRLYKAFFSEIEARFT